MRASSGEFEVLLEEQELPAVEHGPEDVDASSGEGKDGLVVALPFAPLAVPPGPQGAAGGRAPKARLSGWPREQKADW
jgi:hypothetical protein